MNVELQVAVELQGYEVYRTSLVPREPTHRLDCSLAPASTERVLSIESIPSGAKIWLGDAEYGTTPLAGAKVLVGKVLRVRMEKEGYKPFRLDIPAAEIPPSSPLILKLEELEWDTAKCAGDDGRRWLERLRTSGLPYGQVEALRECFHGLNSTEGWNGVIETSSVALNDKTYKGQARDYFARAYARFRLGGKENLRRCAEDADMAERRRLGLEQCELWQVQYLRVSCLHGYVARAAGESTGVYSEEDVYDLYQQLRAALENVDTGTLTRKEQECHQEVLRKYKSLKETLERDW